MNTQNMEVNLAINELSNNIKLIEDEQEKINNKETFQVLLINNQQEDADYYIYCVDYMMKSVT